MAVNDRDRDPAVVFPYLVGRPLTAAEVYEAFGYRKSAYYKAAHEGRLISANNLIKVAKHFGLNPVDLQVRFGLIAPEAVSEYVASRSSGDGQPASRPGQDPEDGTPPPPS